MKYNGDNHHRRSIRLKGYDYFQAALYSITICTRNRLCLFGEIVGARSKPALDTHDETDLKTDSKPACLQSTIKKHFKQTPNDAGFEHHLMDFDQQMAGTGACPYDRT